MAFQRVVGGSDDFRRLNEDRGLEPMLSPATVHRPGFIPALVLPGRDQHVLQEGLKGLFQALAGSGWLPLVEFGSNGGQECRNPKGLPVAAFVGFAAPLITEVTCQSFFPGLSVRVIAEGLDSEERRLATWPEQKVGKDLPRPKKKLMEVEATIEARLAKEIGNSKSPTLDRLAGWGVPSPPGSGHVVDLQGAHIQPEVLEVCESLEHRGPLFRFIAPAATVSIAFGMQPPQGQQLVDLCEGVFLRGPCLVEPERAECIEGIGIQVGKCFPLLPEALRPRRTFFRWQVGLGIKQKRAELGRTTSNVSGQEGRGPGDAVEALERIQGEGLPQGLIGRCTEDGQMLILSQWSETDPRGHGVSESEQ